MVLNETAMNMTSAFSGFGSFDNNLWLIVIVVFIVIVFMLFLLFKKFKQFLAGAGTLGIGYGIYRASKYIGVKTAVEHNYTPIIYFGIGVGFIIVSIILGIIIEKLFFSKKSKDEEEDEDEVDAPAPKVQEKPKPKQAPELPVLKNSLWRQR